MDLHALMFLSQIIFPIVHIAEARYVKLAPELPITLWINTFLLQNRY